MISGIRGLFSCCCCCTTHEEEAVVNEEALPEEEHKEIQWKLHIKDSVELRLGVLSPHKIENPNVGA